MIYRAVKTVVMGCPLNHQKAVALDWCKECQFFKGVERNSGLERDDIKCIYDQSEDVIKWHRMKLYFLLWYGLLDFSAGLWLWWHWTPWTNILTKEVSGERMVNCTEYCNTLPKDEWCECVFYGNMPDQLKSVMFIMAMCGVVIIAVLLAYYMRKDWHHDRKRGN